MNMTRRGLLVATALAPLAACGTGSSITPANIINIAQTALLGIQGGFNQLIAADPSLIPGPTASQITTYLTTGIGASKSLVAGMDATAGASVVQVVETDLNAVMNVLGGPPVNGLIPAPFNQAFAAVAIVLPTLEAFVNQYLPTAAAASPETTNVRLKFAAIAPTMTSAQALTVLQSYAAK